MSQFKALIKVRILRERGGEGGGGSDPLLFPSALGHCLSFAIQNLIDSSVLFSDGSTYTCMHVSEKLHQSQVWRNNIYMQAGQTCYSTDLTVWSGISPGLYRMLFDSTMSSTTLLLEIWKNWMESTDDTQLRSNQSEGCICLLDWKGRPSTTGPQHHPKISITADNGTWWCKILACLRTWAGSIPTMIDLWNFSLCNHTHVRDITYPNRNDHTATLQGIYNCPWKSYMQIVHSLMKLSCT